MLSLYTSRMNDVRNIYRPVFPVYCYKQNVIVSTLSKDGHLLQCKLASNSSRFLCIFYILTNSQFSKYLSYKQYSLLDNLFQS